MRRAYTKFSPRMLGAIYRALLLLSSLSALPLTCWSQGTGLQPDSDASASKLRLERVPVEGGAELLVIFSRQGSAESREAAVPLVAVLRDTLGDENIENDRLRYVWSFGYTRPSLAQRVAADVPFFYFVGGGEKHAGSRPPPPLLDLAGDKNRFWRKLLWAALRSALIDPRSALIGTALRNRQLNADDYRQGQLTRTLEIFSLLEAQATASPVFTPEELQKIQARLRLAGKATGGVVDDLHLRDAGEKLKRKTEEIRGRNWELLRQRAEAEGLYFEPLTLPDGRATHALLWIAQGPDQQHRLQPTRRFNPRFLNITDPGRDARLRRWEGYTETRWFDADDQRVGPGTAGARAVEMIPLAIYGLDHPRLPALLIDFRDRLNPRHREASLRVINDLAALSGFGSPYFSIGHTLFDFVAGRRGADISQPSRLRALSQLRLLLSLDESLAPQLREEISRRLTPVSLSPLENEWRTEAQLAREQFTALIASARRSGGLPAGLARDRRAEMMPLAHGRAGRFFFRAASLVSFGLYQHRESPTPELMAKLDLHRRLQFHERFLSEAVQSGTPLEVGENIADVRRSLQFISAHGAAADDRAARLIARVLRLTNDEETRLLCRQALARMKNRTAGAELRRLQPDQCGEMIEQKECDQENNYCASATHH
ncbi:MAG TPA: hypothetical protein VFD58_18225 [Blastocatellia bacterium]|nr:hypothetical protein [Blastocatellia bacterium]